MKRRRGSEKRIDVRKEGRLNWGVKGAGWLQASSHVRPRVTSHTKGSSLSACKADARTMLKEKRTTTLTQLLVARLVSGRHAGEPRCKGDTQIQHWKPAIAAAICKPLINFSSSFLRFLSSSSWRFLSSSWRFLSLMMGLTFALPLEGSTFVEPLEGAKSSKTFIQPLEGQTFARPWEGQTFNLPLEGQAFNPHLEGQTFARPLEGQTFNPPLEGQTFARPLEGQAFNPPTEGQPFAQPLEGQTFTQSWEVILAVRIGLA